MENSIAKYDMTQDAMTPATVVNQVQLIQHVMEKVMKDGEHYGIIPGCGNKPTLLKGGAEKLSLTFRLSPSYEVTEKELGNGHREYYVKCTLTHIPTDKVFGQGVGACSTMEGKYRFRTGEVEFTGKEVPKEYWTNRDINLIGGKGFGTKKNKSGKWEIVRAGEKVEHDNPADYYNCVTPDMLVLTHDLQWIPAGEIETGDTLIGVDETASSQYARNFAIGEATVYGRKTDQLYQITFDDGRIVKCNGEHQWLVKKIGLKGTEWAATHDIYEEMRARIGRPRKWSVMSVCSTWNEDTTKGAGYIAGLVDADGSLCTSQLYVHFAQQDNICLANIQSELSQRGYKTSARHSCCVPDDVMEKRESKKQVYSLRVLGGITEQLRFLGSIRPHRLLERWLTMFDLSERRLEGSGSGAGKPAVIKSIEKIGDGEIVMLGTSCRTYIAEGLICHNTVLKMAKKRAHVDAVLTATAASDIFTQDVEDMPEVIPPVKNVTPPPDVPPIEVPPQTQPEQEPQGNTVFTALKDISSKSGETNGKKWTLYTITTETGDKYGTFDANIADLANSFIDSGELARITFELTTKGNKQIVELAA